MLAFTVLPSTSMSTSTVKAFGANGGGCGGGLGGGGEGDGGAGLGLGGGGEGAGGDGEGGGGLGEGGGGLGNGGAGHSSMASHTFMHSSLQILLHFLLWVELTQLASVPGPLP